METDLQRSTSSPRLRPRESDISCGANPFGLKALHLRKIASLVRAYFPQCKSIGCFSRVTDVAAKTDEELAELAAAGFDGLTIGHRDR